MLDPLYMQHFMKVAKHFALGGVRPNAVAVAKPKINGARLGNLPAMQHNTMVERALAAIPKSGTSLLDAVHLAMQQHRDAG